MPHTLVPQTAYRRFMDNHPDYWTAEEKEKRRKRNIALVQKMMRQVKKELGVIQHLARRIK